MTDLLHPPPTLRARDPATLNARFRDAAPEAVLAWTVEAFPGRVALLSSFGTEAALSLAILAQVAPSTPVLFLDTGLHFAPTLDYRRNLALRLGLTDVRDLRAPDATPDLWKTDTDACCAQRKVEPLAAVLPQFDVLITGRKRVHGGDRMRLPLFETVEGQLRLNLLVGLSPIELERRFAAADLPRHPLAEAGFRSIGCWPCSRPSEEGDATSRSGRWAGSAKTECGIHLPRAR